MWYQTLFPKTVLPWVKQFTVTLLPAAPSTATTLAEVLGLLRTLRPVCSVRKVRCWTAQAGTPAAGPPAVGGTNPATKPLCGFTMWYQILSPRTVLPWVKQFTVTLLPTAPSTANTLDEVLGRLRTLRPVCSVRKIWSDDAWCTTAAFTGCGAADEGLASITMVIVATSGAPAAASASRLIPVGKTMSFPSAPTRPS